jgi:hypothetical protein
MYTANPEFVADNSSACQRANELETCMAWASYSAGAPVANRRQQLMSMHQVDTINDVNVAPHRPIIATHAAIRTPRESSHACAQYSLATVTATCQLRAVDVVCDCSLRQSKLCKCFIGSGAAREQGPIVAGCIESSNQCHAAADIKVSQGEPAAAGRIWTGRGVRVRHVGSIDATAYAAQGPRQRLALPRA